jgi:hypothetical protein
VNGQGRTRRTAFAAGGRTAAGALRGQRPWRSVNELQNVRICDAAEGSACSRVVTVPLEDELVQAAGTQGADGMQRGRRKWRLEYNGGRDASFSSSRSGGRSRRGPRATNTSLGPRRQQQDEGRRVLSHAVDPVEAICHANFVGTVRIRVSGHT